MDKFKLLSLSMLTATSLYATTISGIGYASLESEAQKEALADLSNRISVNVKSDFQTITKALGSQYSKSNEKVINLSSDLPIVGAVFDTLVGNTLVKTTAILDSATSLKLYDSELKRVYKEISHGLLELETIKNDNSKYTILNSLLSNIQSYQKYKVVAIVLGSDTIQDLPVTKSEIELKLQNMQTDINSIELASKLLLQNITQKDIYISAIKPNGSHEVTQFAKILKNSMMKNLSTVTKSNDASYFLKGNYEILPNSIFITVNLYDQNNNIVHTNTAKLNPNAYKNTSYKPSTKTFDMAMNTGFVKSGNLDVKIGFKGYNRDDGIELHSGDTVDIVVKANKPMCYFLVGHTLKENDKFSYLVPIGSDDTPYTNYITGSDINYYITIAGDIPVEAPYGSETLQIFSSTLDKNTCSLTVPTCVENSDGYCIIAGKPDQVVGKTRALNFKKKKVEVEKAESSISWTSFEK